MPKFFRPIDGEEETTAAGDALDDSFSKYVTLDASMISKPNYESEKEDQSQELPSTGSIAFNVRALSRTSATYELEKFDKHVLIIFNQENLDGYIRPRYGSEKDVEALKNTFGNLGFEVEEYKDYTKSEIFQVLREFSQRDFTDYGCIAVAVLTHGTDRGYLRAKDRSYNEMDIISHFKVHDKPTLVTKPKILIVQACRGSNNRLRGVMVGAQERIERDHDSNVEPYTLPRESDMLILHSCYMGNPSHRAEIYGSWFIQKLCQKINNLSPTHDMESIMVEVKREVAINMYHSIMNEATLEMDLDKQMPVMTSTLIRKLYFKNYRDVHDTHTDSQTEFACGPSTEQLHVLDRSSSLASGAPVEAIRAFSVSECSCFLHHFEYMKKCLRKYVNEYPDDLVADGYLVMADAFQDTREFNSAKLKLLQLIKMQIEKTAKDSPTYELIYFNSYDNALQ